MSTQLPAPNAGTSSVLSQPTNPLPHTPAPSALPISQLESLKFKASQIIDSIQALQRTIEGGHQGAMPAWPDILSKYNILLSQTHSFSMALAGNPGSGPGAGRGGAGGNIFERIALHPSMGMSDTQLDGEVIPLLRNQQTLDVLRMENETVRRIADHMATKGSVGVLGSAGQQSQDARPGGYGYSNGIGKGKVEYEDVLRECEEIRSAHDRRVERAVRAVTMLRERFDWKQRVVVEVEEPEELEWDPRMRQTREENEHDNRDDAHGESNGEGEGGEDGDGDVGMESNDGASSDEDEVEGALVNPGSMEMHSPAQQLHSLPSGDGMSGMLPALNLDVQMPPATDSTDFGL